MSKCKDCSFFKKEGTICKIDGSEVDPEFNHEMPCFHLHSSFIIPETEGEEFFSIRGD